MSFKNVTNMVKSLAGKAALYGGKKLLGHLSPYIGDAAASLTHTLHRADILKPETSEKILDSVLKGLTGNLSTMNKEKFKNYMLDQSQKVISDEMKEYQKELYKKEKETEDIIKSFDKSIPDRPLRGISTKRLQKQKDLNIFLSDLRRQKKHAIDIETEKAKKIARFKDIRSVGPLQYSSPPINRVNYSTNPVFYQSPYKSKVVEIQKKKISKVTKKKKPVKRKPRKRKQPIKRVNKAANPAFASPPKKKPIKKKQPIKITNAANPAFAVPPKTKNYQEQPLPKPQKKSKKKNFNIVI
jgi:hypothetical protein